MGEVTGSGPFELPTDWTNADHAPRWEELSGSLVAFVRWRLDDWATLERLHRLDREVRRLGRDALVLGLHEPVGTADRVRARLLARNTWAPSGRLASRGTVPGPAEPGSVFLVDGGELTSTRGPGVPVERIVGEIRGQAREGRPSWRPRGAAPGPWPLAYPSDVAVSGSRIALADTGHNRVLLAASGGEITHMVGDGTPGHADGDLAQARFETPQGLAWEEERLIVADTGNDAIREVDLGAGTVSTRAHLDEGALPAGVAVPAEAAPAVALAGRGQLAAVTDDGLDPIAGPAELGHPVDLVRWEGGWLVADLDGPRLVHRRADGTTESIWSGDPLVEPLGLWTDGSEAAVADPAAGAVFDLDPGQGPHARLAAEDGPEQPGAIAAEIDDLLVADVGGHHVWRIKDERRTRLDLTEPPLQISEHIRLDPVELAPDAELTLQLSYLPGEEETDEVGQPGVRGPLGDVQVGAATAQEGRVLCEVTGRARGSGNVRVRWPIAPDPGREVAWDLPLLVRPGADEELRLALSSSPP